MNKEDQSELVKARPEILPNPTYMPFMLAVSITFVGWGFISSWIIGVAGLIGTGIAIYGWIKDLLHEPRDQS